MSAFSGNSGVLVNLGFLTDFPYDTLALEMIDLFEIKIQMNVLTSFENGSLIITSPEPVLSLFPETISYEDSLVIMYDTLYARV